MVNEERRENFSNPISKLSGNDRHGEKRVNKALLDHKLKRLELHGMNEEAEKLRKQIEKEEAEALRALDTLREMDKAMKSKGGRNDQRFQSPPRPQRQRLRSRSRSPKRSERRRNEESNEPRREDLRTDDEEDRRGSNNERNRGERSDNHRHESRRDVRERSSEIRKDDCREEGEASPEERRGTRRRFEDEEQPREGRYRAGESRSDMRCGRDHRDRSLEGRRDRSPVESRKRRFEEDDKIETGYERRRSSGGCDNNHRYESGEEGEEVNDAKGGDYNESGKRGGGRFDQPPPDRLE